MNNTKLAEALNLGLECALELVAEKAAAFKGYPDKVTPYLRMVDFIRSELAALAAHDAEQAAKAVPADLIAFLDGRAPLEGVWFGDRHPSERGLYWWRKYLRAPTPPAPEAVALPTAEDINAQDWAGMDGATAYQLIQRHGEDWSHIGRLMNAWLLANRPAQAAPEAQQALASDSSWTTVRMELEASGRDDLSAWVASQLSTQAQQAVIPDGMMLVESGWFEKNRNDWYKFHYLMKDHGLHPGRTDDSLLDILRAHLEAKAQQAAGQEPYTRERHFAVREAHCIGDGEKFWKARPGTKDDGRAIAFDAGYMRGFDKGAELADARAALVQHPNLSDKVVQKRLAAQWGYEPVQRSEPLTVPHPGSPEAKAMIDSELALRDWPANHFNAARAGYEACRKLAGLGVGATTGEQHG